METADGKEGCILGSPTKELPACVATCSEHREHVSILCYGTPTMVRDRDYLSADPAHDYPISHYVGYTRQLPPVKRIRQHGALSAHYIAQIRPGNEEDEESVKRDEVCPTCGEPLWYYAESPTRAK